MVILPTPRSMLIKSPGGNLQTTMGCPKVSIEIRGVEFHTPAIVIDTVGIDIIVGMETLIK